MPSKLFLRIDRGSISPADFLAMTTATQVHSIDAPEDCFQFSFERICLDHAMLLLGENKSRFGFDLWHYLHSAHGFFGRISDGFVVMPNGTPDFKKRYSEDLGVAIGTLLLVNCIDLRLETVAQIPTNTRLDKHAKVPDFVGFDGAKCKRVYECKGTTASDQIDKQRQKAKSQLADHHEANVSKFAIVTYVPTSFKLIPPYIFVSDPPIALPQLSLAVATGLHLLLVLEFSGLETPINPLRQMLATWVKHEQILSDGGEIAYRARLDFEKKKQKFGSEITTAVEQAVKIPVEDRQFAGVKRTSENQEKKVEVFTAVDANYVLEVANALANGGPKQNFAPPTYQNARSEIGKKVGNYSQFSDGSLLYVYPVG